MATKLNSPSNRVRIPKGKRVVDTIAKGIAVVYRRGKAASADGTWSVRVRTNDGPSPYTLAAVGLADDLTASDGVKWLTYREAVEFALRKAKTMLRDKAAAPLSVGEAVQSYIERRRARGTGRPGDDATALDKYLGSLAQKKVAGLEHGMLQAFAHKAPRNVCRSLRAAFEFELRTTSGRAALF